MANISFHKVNSLPANLTPNGMYFIKIGERLELWVANSEGSEAYLVSSDTVVQPLPTVADSWVYDANGIVVTIPEAEWTVLPNGSFQYSGT